MTSSDVRVRLRRVPQADGTEVAQALGHPRRHERVPPAEEARRRARPSPTRSRERNAGIARNARNAVTARRCDAGGSISMSTGYAARTTREPGERPTDDVEERDPRASSSESNAARNRWSGVGQSAGHERDRARRLTVTTTTTASSTASSQTRCGMASGKSEEHGEPRALERRPSRPSRTGCSGSSE